jgi:imidazolonepropionase
VERLATSATVATLLPATSFFLGLPYANVRRLIDGNARVALATDFNPGTAPAPDLPFTNLLAASQLRMSPAEILCACTYNAACALDMQETHGSLQPGRSADLLLFAGSASVPGEGGIAIIAEIVLNRAVPELVIKNGKVVAGIRRRTARE